MDIPVTIYINDVGYNVLIDQVPIFKMNSAFGFSCDWIVEGETFMFMLFDTHLDLLDKIEIDVKPGFLNEVVTTIDVEFEIIESKRIEYAKKGS